LKRNPTASKNQLTFTRFEMNLPSVSAPSSESSPAAEPDSASWFTNHIHVHDSALKSYLRRSFPDARSEVDDVVQE